MQTNPDYEMHLRPEEDYEMHFDDAGLKPEQTATVTPTYEKQTVRPDPGCVFSEVTVEAITEPTEEIDITENGPVNVARYGVANVAVPVGVFPSGTKLITQNVTGEDVTNFAAVDVAVPGPTGTKPISITANGTTTEDVTDYAEAEITVNTLPAKGLVFGDYDADGYPHSAEIVGFVNVPSYYGDSIFYKTNGMCKNISILKMHEGLETIDQQAFEYGNCLRHLIFPESFKTFTGNGAFSGDNLLSVTFLRNVESIKINTFSSRKITLYDFSNASFIPILEALSGLTHASGCVIRIPAALSDTTLGEGNGWESETNWCNLTNIVWEVV